MQIIFKYSANGQILPAMHTAIPKGRRDLVASDSAIVSTVTVHFLLLTGLTYSSRNMQRSLRLCLWVNLSHEHMPS